jgi:hypothetical protein
MIWYVDIEHEKALADPKRAPDFERVQNYRAGGFGRDLWGKVRAYLLSPG